MGAVLLGVAVSGVVLSAAVFFMFINIYNNLVSLRKQVDRSWANIDVILKQRHDEIPNLVSVCEQFAGYERATLDRLMQARERYGQAGSLGEKVKAANEVSGFLGSILALGEAYPELKSSEHFHQLQTRISKLEDNIADRREHFNETVTNYNTRIHQIPDLFFARVLNYGELELYKVQEADKKAPRIKMKLPAA